MCSGVVCVCVRVRLLEKCVTPTCSQRVWIGCRLPDQRRCRYCHRRLLGQLGGASSADLPSAARPARAGRSLWRGIWQRSRCQRPGRRIRARPVRTGLGSIGAGSAQVRAERMKPLDEAAAWLLRSRLRARARAHASSQAESSQPPPPSVADGSRVQL